MKKKAPKVAMKKSSYPPSPPTGLARQKVKPMKRAKTVD